MEEAMENCSNWYNVLHTKTLSNTEFLAWMKHQTTTTTTPPHHHPFTGDDVDDDDHHVGGAAATAAAAVAPVRSTNKSSGATVYRPDLLSSAAYAIGGGNTTISHLPFHYSPGGGMAFTAGQWKELERQAMVYKCMISCVPVPPHLLYPLDSSSPCNFYGGGGGSGRYSRKGDLEPGRCKRTDGKKWRCSREVAPLQKYCDRHLHRGRPRSRKPVELNNNNNTAPNHKKTRTKSPPLPLFKPKPHLTISTPPYFNTNNRNLGVTRQPWEDPIQLQAEMEISNQSLYDYRSSFNHDYAPLDLFSYPNIASQGTGMAAGFIGNDGDLSTSLNLSMAMAVGDVLDEQMRNIQTTRDEEDLVWLNPGCWEPFARGGPLAEALQSGASNPASPYTSSPSGVLQRTLFSQSDGSACNSPTATFRLMEN